MISDIGIEMKFVILLLFGVFVWGDAEVRCKEREREALVSFKNGLIDEFDILSSWRGDECCNWYGVVCSNTSTDDGQVIRLELDARDYYGVLGGNVSSSLLELHHLSYLDLSWNDFGGNPIPEFIYSMKQLQHLYLWKSNFFGVVPPEIGNLTNLRSLDLSYNSLSCANLDWLSSLSLLSFLDLSSFDLSHTNWLQHILPLHSLNELHLKSCNIEDVKPSSILFVNSSSSSSLSSLDMSDNHLTSSAFDWLSNVSSSLVSLDLLNNSLGGLNPNVFERFTHLEHLDLSANMLEGEIPKSLGNLSQLQVLVLYANELRGDLNEFVGNLSSKGLEILDLTGNQLTGSVPDLTPFSSLTEVYLGGNKFTGALPVSVGQLSKLQILEVSHNYLEGTVSESHFIMLHNLKELDLSFNSLSLQITSNWIPPFQLKAILLAGCNVGSSFPKWIQTQRNLIVLDLSGAGIIDEVPSWLWSFSPLLEDLFLSHNQISGTIPDLSSTSILRIDVTSNKFSGPIPLFHKNSNLIHLNQNMFCGSISSICEILHDRLEFLGLSNNQLSGELPDCWEKIPNLSTLELANNSFSGEVPHSFGSLHELYVLQLRDNNLSGELPSTLRFCQQLVLFDVGGNKLTGEMSVWIGDIERIQYLNLGSNRLHGHIPPGICNLARIRILDIGINNLSGKIPDCFNNFTTLADKNTSPLYVFGFRFGLQYNRQLPNMFLRNYNAYSSVGWKGQESEYRQNLNLLKLIDFSSNRLAGNIPESFSSMKGLRSLNLSRNSLTGNIIPDVGQMEMLESLDLSENKLSGEIPTSLAQLHFLSFLDLSNNSLSGRIPSSTQLQSFSTSSYAGNNGLCGHPLTKLCPGDSRRPPTTGKKEERNERDDGFWGLSFMQEFGISMGLGFIFGFWGVVGSFIVKRSWRIAFFKLLDVVGDWFYEQTAIFLSKFRRS